MKNDKSVSIYKLWDCDTRWGDFGSIIVSGYFNLPDDKQSLNPAPDDYELWRTGPFIPPITFPGGSCVVDNELKTSLELTGFTGFRFSPVRVGKIVAVDWQSWDRTKDVDFENRFPQLEVYAVEDILINSPNAVELKKDAKQLWKLEGETVKFEWAEFSEEHRVLSLSRSEIDKYDFFTPSRTVVYVSEPAKKWIERSYSEWVTFKEVEVTE